MAKREKEKVLGIVNIKFVSGPIEFDAEKRGAYAKLRYSSNLNSKDIVLILHYVVQTLNEEIKEESKKARIESRKKK